MSYIPSHREIKDHPKTKKAARVLGISVVTMVGHLHFLWWWALDYAPDGDVTKYENADIAEGAGWEGDPNVFAAALTNCGMAGGPGYLEETEEGRLVLHDWHEGGGKVLEAKEKHREAVTKYRERSRATHETDGDNHETITRPSRDALDKIREDKTRLDEIKEDVERAPTPIKKAAGKTALPKGWAITADMEVWASKNVADLRDLDTATEEWLDYCRREACRYADWTAAWRNGMKRALEFQREKEKRNAGNNSGRRKSAAQLGAEYIERVLRGEDESPEVVRHPRLQS